jgi:type IV pilus assembly protein PilF
MATRQWNGRKNSLNVGGMRVYVAALITGVLSIGLIACNSSPSRSANKEAQRLEGSDHKPNYANAAKIYAQLGLGYLSQGEVVRAKKKLTSALEYAPKNAEVISAWGIYWEHVGDINEARSFHEKALRLAKPEQVGIVYDAYGSFLCRQGRWEEAQRAFKRALVNRQSLNLAFIYESAGLCAANTQHTTEAEEYLVKALQMDTQRSRAALALSQLKVNQGAFREASKWLLQYEKFGPETAQSVFLALQVAKGLHQKEQIENLELLFKRSFHDTPEYQAYQKSLSSTTKLRMNSNNDDEETNHINNKG